MGPRAGLDWGGGCKPAIEKWFLKYDLRTAEAYWYRKILNVL